jgi:hypothetical protein
MHISISPKHISLQTLCCGILAVSCFLLSTNAAAARCGTQLINKGDSQAKILKYCGKPATKSFYHAMRHGSYPKRGEDGEWVENEKNYRFYGRTEVLVEDWVYNFGPNKFMRKVRFTNGIVESVETLERGYREDAKDPDEED